MKLTESEQIQDLSPLIFISVLEVLSAPTERECPDSIRFTKSSLDMRYPDTIINIQIYFE